jgi:hypothetical protein
MCSNWWAINAGRNDLENFNVQFRAEFSNVLNCANFAMPIIPANTDISTTTTARELQFALKIIG